MRQKQDTELVALKRELPKTRELVKAYQERGHFSCSFPIASPELARFLAVALANGITETTDTEPEALQKPIKPTPPDIALKLEDRRQVIKWNDRVKVDDPSSLDCDRLQGEWHEWLEVAKLYEVKVPYQDRYDMRHDIMIELARARARDGEPIPTLRAYRIASLTVSLYWRELLKQQVKVCIYDGVAKEPNCPICRHKPKIGQCPYLALRPIISLESEVEDTEGNIVTLKETVADDHAIDLDLWLDAKTFKLGCPMRLVEIAHKKRTGKPLTGKDRKYLCKMLKRYQKPLF